MELAPAAAAQGDQVDRPGSSFEQDALKPGLPRLAGNPPRLAAQRRHHHPETNPIGGHRLILPALMIERHPDWQGSPHDLKWLHRD
jgi:hypothetical protein